MQLTGKTDCFIQPLIIHCLTLVILTLLQTVDTQKDLVQPDETHLEGVPFFIQHPKPMYYTLKGHPATIECIAEPVSHAVIECAEQIIPYKGPDESGKLKVTRLNSENQPDPNGKRWHLELQVRTKEVEEWFDSYKCRCEAWNKVIELKRPKKVVSNIAEIVEAYLDRKFQLEPVSTDLTVGKRLILTCMPPRGKPDPEVYWLKDGERVTQKAFPQILINDYNHLVIENATSTDSGNYTCVAECLGVEYRYATAKVTITATTTEMLMRPTDSPASPETWTEWTECSWTAENLGTRLCQQTRYRACAVNLINLPSMVPESCPKPWTEIHNCSSSNCENQVNGATLYDSKHTIGPSYTGEGNFEGNQTRDITIYIVLFIVLSAIMVVVCILIKRGVPTPANNCHTNNGCFRGSNPYLGEKTSTSNTITNGKTVKKPLLMNKFRETSLDRQFAKHSPSPMIQQKNMVEPHQSYSAYSSVLATTLLSGSIDPGYCQPEREMPLMPRSILSSPVMNTHAATPHYNTVHQCLGEHPVQNQQQLGYLVANIGSGSTIIQSPTLTPISQLPMISAPSYHVINGAQQSSGPIESSTEYSKPNDDAYIDAIGQADIGGTLFLPSSSQNFYSSSVIPPARLCADSSTGQSSQNTATTATGATAAGSGTDSIGHPLTYHPIAQGLNKSGHLLENGSDDSSSYVHQLPRFGTYEPIQTRNGLQQTFIDDPVLDGFVSEDGAIMNLTTTGITLSIPPDAVQPGESRRIHLGVCTEDRQERPTLNENQTLLSPVVRIETEASNLRMPVTLSLPHCAFIEDGNWFFRLFAKPIPISKSYNEGVPEMYCDHKLPSVEKGEVDIWSEMYSSSHEKSEVGQREIQFKTGLVCRIDNTTVDIHTIYTNHYYCLVGESGSLHIPIPMFQLKKQQHRLATKRLRFAAFAGRRLTACMDYNIRVYVLADTLAALSHVLNLESRLDGCLIDRTDPFAFKDNGTSLCFRIKDVSRGWRSRLQVKTQEIPFRHIWCGTQPSSLHCAFALEHLDETQLSVSCQIVVSQGAHWSQQETLLVSSDNRTEHTFSRLNLAEMYPTHHLDGTAHRLDFNFKQTLRENLQNPTIFKEFADMINLGSTIHQMTGMNDPVLNLLNLWEAIYARTNSSDFLKHLHYAIDQLHIPNSGVKMSSTNYIESTGGFPNYAHRNSETC